MTTSKPGALRGMHYHLRQSDICYVVSGRIFLALVDLRVETPVREEVWLGQDETVLVPPGVAHGYAADTEATVMYLLTVEADGSDEHGFRYDDPAARIRWPVTEPALSARDRDAGPFIDAHVRVRGQLGR